MAASIRSRAACLWREENCSAGGGGDTEAHFPNPPPPSLAAVMGGGGSGQGCPTCRAGGGGGGGNPTSMAQNDTRVALIILTTQMWGAEIIGGKNFFGPKFVFLRLRRQHPFLHKTKGPTRNPISQTPPSFGGRPCHPPPPPAEQFSGRLSAVTSTTRHGEEPRLLSVRDTLAGEKTCVVTGLGSPMWRRVCTDKHRP